MAFPSGVDLVLIASILGIIAISIYTLYLEDKLLSRIENLEETLRTYRSSEGKSTKNPEVKALSEQIGVANQILESTGKDIDSINSKMASFASELASFTQKIETVRDDTSENKNKIASIQSEVSGIISKLEPVEPEIVEEPTSEPPLEF